MAQARVKEHEAIKVRVEGLEDLSLVERVVIFHKGADLQLGPQPPFDHGPERVVGGALRQRELRVPARHALRPDEYDVEFHAREEVAELLPDFAWERRFRPRAKDEDAHWRRTCAQAFHGFVAS